jgi:replicative DNA helicase
MALRVVTTGYRRLNLLTHGWQKEDLIIVAARPSMGKTALAMNFAFNAASRGNVSPSPSSHSK